MSRRVTGLHWSLPPGWHSFTSDQVRDGSWRNELPERVLVPEAESGLRRFEEWVAGEAAARLGWVVVIAPEPHAPAVVAAGSLDVRPGQGIDALEVAVRNAATPEDVVSRTVERVFIADDPALVCHDLVAVAEGPEGLSMRERGIAVRHVVSLGMDVVVDVSTDDLAGFEQIAVSAAEACAGVHLTSEEVPA